MKSEMFLSAKSSKELHHDDTDGPRNSHWPARTGHSSLCWAWFSWRSFSRVVFEAPVDGRYWGDYLGNVK